MITRKKTQLPGGPSKTRPFVMPDLAAGRARLRAGIAAFHEERRAERKGRKSAVTAKLSAAAKEAADA